MTRPIEQHRATVKSITGTKATVALEDGSEREIEVPDMIHVVAGMPVTIIDTGDGKPIYGWGT